MDRQSFTDLIQTKFKMVRIEAGYTQDTMAQTIGLSKTLVQIEKERVLPNWTTFVHYSEIQMLFKLFHVIIVHIQIIQQQVIFIGILSKHVMVLCYKVIK